MKPIGIMQGRLLPRYQNRYQAFPLGYWQGEFHIAREMGFQAIEFILDYNDAEANPLLSREGIRQIDTVIAETGISVFSVCADYFMQAPFHSTHQEKSEQVMTRLIEHASNLPIKDIVIPCVDASSLKTAEDEARFVASVRKLLKVAEKYKINLNLEMDLAPLPFRALLDQFDSPYIKVNYDSGNSASLGFNPNEEFAAYGALISDLHIKDRVRGGGSVTLGTGNADLGRIFQLLKAHHFSGNICMQAARAPQYADEFAMVARQLKTTQALVQSYLTD